MALVLLEMLTYIYCGAAGVMRLRHSRETDAHTGIVTDYYHDGCCLKDEVVHTVRDLLEESPHWKVDNFLSGALTLIRSMLHEQPGRRPTAEQVHQELATLLSQSLSIPGAPIRSKKL